MTDTAVRHDIDAALDYVEAALTGLPAFTETVASAYGYGRIATGMGALLVFLVADAARDTDATPSEIIIRLRENYGGLTE